MIIIIGIHWYFWTTLLSKSNFCKGGLISEGILIWSYCQQNVPYFAPELKI